MEWELAAKFGLPVKVVIDMERASKPEELRKCSEGCHSNLLQFQWTEHTAQRRRDTLNECVRFLTKNTGRDDETDGMSSTYSDFEDEVAHLTGGKALWHPALNRLLMLGGFSVFATSKLRSHQRMWFQLVATFRYVRHYWDRLQIDTWPLLGPTRGYYWD